MSDAKNGACAIRTRHDTFVVALLVLLLLGSDAHGREGASSEVVRISRQSLELGATVEELVRAADECVARHKRSGRKGACEPENLGDEISSGQKTKVASFLIDQTEVSVAAYEQCVRARRCRSPEDPRRTEDFGDESLPMVFVTQGEAAAYCDFRGARLPTEAEFEVAARGLSARSYPWGNHYHHGRANVGRFGSPTTDKSDAYELLAPVRSLPDGRTPSGVFHLSGNAAEWTSTDAGNHDVPPEQRAPGRKIVKGGSFETDPLHTRSTARRSVPPGERSPDIGFRCAHSLGSTTKHSPSTPALK